MCLIGLAWQQHPEYPLIVIANRDEFYQRPANNLHLWPGHAVFAGRDLEAGGTWMGMTRDGRWSAITNVRDGRQAQQQQNNQKHSRGELVRRYLAGSMSPEKYIKSLQNYLQQYQGFNLLLGDQQNLYYLSNKPESVKKLEPGIYGLSNGELNSNWPKVQTIRQQLQQTINNKPTLPSLFSILANKQRADKTELPDTGVSEELELLLSSCFIESENYGTRCSSILLSGKNDMQFHEKTFATPFQQAANKSFHIEITKKPEI